METMLALGLVVVGLAVLAALTQMVGNEPREYKPREYWAMYYGGDGGDR